MDDNKRIIIAVDGYSSTGKSTLAKHLAREIGYVYVDTGAMYRAVTLFAMRQGYIDSYQFDPGRLIEALDRVHLEFRFNKELGYSEMYLNGENVEKQIRSIEVSNLVSQVARVSKVREKLVEQQKRMAVNKGIVMDGRDIGTVVFPDAELKIFMTASPEKRARRRYKEMRDNGLDVSFASVLKNVTDRDEIDTTRKDSPLVRAEDAVVIDNSELCVEETFALAMGYVRAALDR